MSRRVVVLLWETLRRRPAALLRIVVWSVVEAAPAFVIGYVIAHAIQDGFAAHRPLVGFAWLATLGAAWISAAVGARQVVLAVASIVEPLRDRLLGHTVAAAIHRATTDRQPADAAAVARSNLQVELARDAFAAVVTVVRSFAFTVIGVVVGLSALMPQMLLLVLPPLIAGVTLFLVSLPGLARRQRAYLVADELTAETVSTVAGGLRDIVACGAEDRMRAAVDERLTAQADAARALARLTAVRTVALGLGGWLPIAAILIGTPWLVRAGAGAGVVVGALSYVTQSLAPALSGLVRGLGVSGVHLAVSLGRILESPAPPAEVVPRIPVVEADVALKNVTFAYAAHAEPVIADLDLDVPAGDHIAVVGPSGIGKSTLAALISGLLEPGTGTVRIGGVPATALDPASRVLIPQEAYVFRGTLLENIVYLRQPGEISESEVEGAVAAVGAQEIVRQVGGYGVEFDPATLSAGQRQLVALARAYLAPTRLTVLDEATCHLDLAAEARAEAAFARRGGTLIVVAHRIASALRARRVLLMDGTRVRLGTHNELVGTVSEYAELVGYWRQSDHEPEREFAA